MDRNIITASDVLRSQRSGSRGYAETSGDEVQLTADDYWGRLTKYLPVEVIGGYLILQGLLQTAYPRPPLPYCRAHPGQRQRSLLSAPTRWGCTFYRETSLSAGSRTTFTATAKITTAAVPIQGPYQSSSAKHPPVAKTHVR